MQTYAAVPCTAWRWEHLDTDHMLAWLLTLMDTSYCCFISFILSKTKRMDREMMPSLSPEVLSCLPIVPIAKVFPDPVCP